MGELSQECRLADARLAGDLDRKAGVERRESCGELAAIEQTSHRFRAKENRRRLADEPVPVTSRRVADQRAGRIANLQDIAADRYVPGDRAVQRLRVRIVRSNSRMIGSVQDQLGVSRSDSHDTPKVRAVDQSRRRRPAATSSSGREAPPGRARRRGERPWRSCACCGCRRAGWRRAR